MSVFSVSCIPGRFFLVSSVLRVATLSGECDQALIVYSPEGQKRTVVGAFSEVLRREPAPRV